MTDVLDDYVESPRAHGGLTPEYIYSNSGHRLLCKNCKKFQRTSADWVEGPVLRITCKICKTYEDFVVTEDGLMPEWLKQNVKSFVMSRARKLLRHNGDA